MNIVLILFVFSVANLQRLSTITLLHWLGLPFLSFFLFSPQLALHHNCFVACFVLLNTFNNIGRYKFGDIQVLHVYLYTASTSIFFIQYGDSTMVLVTGRLVLPKIATRASLALFFSFSHLGPVSISADLSAIESFWCPFLGVSFASLVKAFLVMLILVHIVLCKFIAVIYCNVIPN